MSFLQINGFPIPVANDSVRETTEVQGKIDRAYSGKLRADIRAIKRKWELVTTPVTSLYALILRGLFRGMLDSALVDYSATTATTEAGATITIDGEYTMGFYEESLQFDMFTEGQAPRSLHDATTNLCDVDTAIGTSATYVAAIDSATVTQETIV